MNIQPHIYMKRFIFLVSLTGCCLTATAGTTATTIPAQQRDSVERLLQSEGQTHNARRMELLNHLCDLDMALGDTTYILPCWFEAQRQNDLLSMDNLLIPLAMRAIRRKQTDSIEVWKQCCASLPEGWRECNEEYIEMMAEISRWERQEEMAGRLLREQVSIDAKKKPYAAMRTLYTLGILSSFEESVQTKYSLKKSDEYMAEALQIAEGLPFRQAAHFTRQILLGLSASDVRYGKKYLDFIDKFMQEEDMRRRPFYSHRALISALDKLILQGKQLEREELDGYYHRLCKLIAAYPNDPQVPLFFFSPRMHYRYFQAIDQHEQALFWCDSLIAASPRLGLPTVYFMKDKMTLLRKLGRWQEAYDAAELYMQGRDSIQQAKSKQRLEELQTQYDVDRLKREEAERRAQLMWSLLTGALVLMLFAGYIMYSRRMALKNRILVQQLQMHAEELKRMQVLQGQQDNDKKKEQRQDNDKKELQQDDKQELQQDDRQESVQETILTEKQEENSAAADLYQRITELIRTEKLYLQPELNRTILLERLGTNKNKFAKAFEAGEAQGLNEYIRLLRLQESLLLMEREPDLSLSEVSDRSGFATYSSFYRAFFKQYGVKPTEYRKLTK